VRQIYKQAMKLVGVVYLVVRIFVVVTVSVRGICIFCSFIPLSRGGILSYLVVFLFFLGKLRGSADHHVWWSTMDFAWDLLAWLACSGFFEISLSWLSLASG
jgi:hypothetical protein